VMLPYDFAKRLKSGKTATVQMIVDGTNSNTATIAMSYATNILSEAGMNILVDRLRRLGTRVEPLLIENQPRVWYNPDLKSLNYMVPGVICILLMQMLVPMTSGNIVREKERGTIEQLRVTPLRAGEMILGKTIPGVIIGYFNIFVILIVGTLWFGVPLRGNVFTLLFTSGIFIISSLALGVVISTFTQTQEQAMFVTQFFMIPNMFLSGFMFPINSMPSLMQYCTYVIPLRYFLVIVRGIFLKGVGLAILWPETLALAIFSVLMLALSVYRFGKTK
jgi:ABC-2 type transport system permease protein